MDTKTNDDRCNELVHHVISDWNSILSLWHAIGFSEADISKRNADLVTAIREELTSIRSGEADLMSKIEETIAKYKARIHELISRLSLNANQIPNLTAPKNSLSLIDEEKHYRSLYRQIEEVKVERQRRLRDLKSKEYELCELLDEASYTIGDTSAIPEHELENLESHIVTLAKEKQRRLASLRQAHDDATRLAGEFGLHVDANSVLCHFVRVSSSSFSEAIDEFPIDAEFMETLRLSLDKLEKRRDALVSRCDELRAMIGEMWRRFDLADDTLVDVVRESKCSERVLDVLEREFERCCVVKRENMGAMVRRTRKHIEALWDRCCVGDDERRKSEIWRVFDSHSYCDRMLDEHEEYLARLRAFYGRFEALYGLVDQWNSTWESYVNFEQEYSDPNRFKWRSYSSLFEERERRRFQSELPKIEAQIGRGVNVAAEGVADGMMFDLARITVRLSEKKELYAQLKDEMRKDRLIKKESESKQVTPVNQLRVKTLIQAKRGAVCSSASPARLKRLVEVNKENFGSHSTSKADAVVKRSLRYTVCAQGMSTPKDNRKAVPLYNRQTAATLSKRVVSQPLKDIAANKDLVVKAVAAGRKTSIKSLNEKFKRRSRRSGVVKDNVVATKVHYEPSINEESGIYGSSNEATCSNTNANNVIKGEQLESFEEHIEDEFEAFKANDLISSTFIDN